MAVRSSTRSRQRGAAGMTMGVVSAFANRRVRFEIHRCSGRRHVALWFEHGIDSEEGLARRKESGIEVVASIPWPIGIMLGLIGYIAIRYEIGWFLASSTNPFLSTLGKQAAAGGYAPIGWMLLGACWIGAFASFLGQRKRRRLLDTQTESDSLRAINWREFEMLVGEAFRRQDYAIQETGISGADGGIALILRKDGKTTLVQQAVAQAARRRKGGTRNVRVAGAPRCGGREDCRAERLYARRVALRAGQPIELVHGDALLATVRAVQTAKAQDMRHRQTRCLRRRDRHGSVRNLFDVADRQRACTSGYLTPAGLHHDDPTRTAIGRRARNSHVIQSPACTSASANNQQAYATDRYGPAGMEAQERRVDENLGEDHAGNAVAVSVHKRKAHTTKGQISK